MQPEDIDKLFRDQLRDHAPAPPAYLWNQLEAELKPAKKRPAMWLYAAAAVVALLLVAGGGWLWQTPGAGTLAGSAVKSTAPAPAAPVAAEKTSVAQATPPRQTPSTLPEANRAETLTAATPAPAAPQAAIAQRSKIPVRFAATLTKPAKAARAGRSLPPAQEAPAAFATATTARPERPVEEEKALSGLAKAETVAPDAPAPAAGTIEVEVRRGRPEQALALADAPQERRLVGRLLRKAGSVALREVREKVDVPVVTLNVLNHSLSTKDIQL
ncbi:hypothetical protein [Hymenobacter persicinus]|uniref:Uncharacterized protein n=1 Tax=Hymenobacter persicinus TaxID=2025506 RepID=A0A4Q5LF76_9BACT|nr:hypothetical protein [Hymenobacter persicinus]RYU83294.1 hypothetical protein EWM57_03125 [Hymenobacter persicinus]